jgi:hypothetical protein
MRHRLRSATRVALALLIAAMGVLCSAGSVSAATPAPAPGQLPRLSAAALAPLYAANRSYLRRAERMSTRAGLTDRASALGRMAAADRTFLEADARGTGRLVEVHGDLARARNIVVFVPGADTTVASFDAGDSQRPWLHAQGGARALHRAIAAQPGAPDTAVIDWLGYRAPELLSTEVMSDELADPGARALRDFITRLHRLHPSSVRLLCHSYGSVVCGKAVRDGAEVRDLAVFGSPGTGVDSRRQLHTRARVWAGRSSNDWIGSVPHLRVDFLGATFGFGADPARPSFGARSFPAGRGEHGEYLRPGGPALRSLAAIAVGRRPVG